MPGRNVSLRMDSFIIHMALPLSCVHIIYIRRYSLPHSIFVKEGRIENINESKLRIPVLYMKQPRKNTHLRWQNNQ